MTRTAAGKPYVLHFGVPVNEKIPARSIFVLAHARLHNRRSAQGRESPRHIFVHGFGHLRRNDSRLGVGIHLFTVLVERNLQSTTLDVRHPVDQVFLKQPRRQRWRSKSRFAGRYAEKENFLPRGKNSSAEHIRENLPQPRPTCKDELSRGDTLSLVRSHVLHGPCFSWVYSLPAAILHAKPSRIFHHGRHGPPGHQHPTKRLEYPFLNFLKPNLWIVFLKRRAVTPFKRHAAALQCRRRFLQPRIILSSHPQDARFEEERLLRGRRKLLPLLQRPLRPSRVQLIRPVAHANNARLAAGTCPRVPRPIRFYQRDALAAFRQMPRRPRPKHPCANHRHVVGFSPAHLYNFISSASYTSDPALENPFHLSWHRVSIFRSHSHLWRFV